MKNFGWQVVALIFLFNYTCLAMMPNETHEEEIPAQEAMAAPEKTASSQTPVQATAAPVGQGLQWERELTPEDQIEQGVTTKTEEPRGNWFRKKQFFSSARELYYTIRDLVNGIVESINEFIKKRESLDKEVEDFTIKNSFKQGEINEKINNFTEQINKIREKGGTLTEDERTLNARLVETKNELEELSKEQALIYELYSKLGQSITILLEQISLCRAYQEKALNNYEQIAEVLSDEVAERLYLEMKGYHENVVQTQTFIQGEFKKYFDDSINLIHETMKKVESHVENLKEKGVVFSKEISEDLEKKSEEEKRKLQEEVVCKIPEEKGFLASLWEYITYPFVYLYNYFLGEPVAQPIVKKAKIVTEEKPLEISQPLVPIEKPELKISEEKVSEITEIPKEQKELELETAPKIEEPTAEVAEPEKTIALQETPVGQLLVEEHREITPETTEPVTHIPEIETQPITSEIIPPATEQLVLPEPATPEQTNILAAEPETENVNQNLGINEEAPPAAPTTSEISEVTAEMRVE